MYVSISIKRVLWMMERMRRVMKRVVKRRSVLCSRKRSMDRSTEAQDARNPCHEPVRPVSESGEVVVEGLDCVSGFVVGVEEVC